MALWSGASLGTLNVSLLILWPIVLPDIRLQNHEEEALLQCKFGDQFRHYVRKTGRLFPRVGKPRPPPEANCGKAANPKTCDVKRFDTLVQPVNAEWGQLLQSAPAASVVESYARLRGRWEWGHLAAFVAWACRGHPAHVVKSTAGFRPTRCQQPLSLLALLVALVTSR